MELNSLEQFTFFIFVFLPLLITAILLTVINTCIYICDLVDYLFTKMWYGVDELLFTLDNLSTTGKERYTNYGTKINILGRQR